MLLDFADLSLANKGEIYLTLYEQIKKAIKTKAIKPGEKLPSVREAAAELGVSRTTIENAYTRLCIEGFAESIPQKGYFIIAPVGRKYTPAAEKTAKEPKIIYDFSSRRVDEKASDTNLWKKTVRSVLWDSGELISYGDPQGEPGLRAALADYSFKARGVSARAENILIGAGAGPLLNILCGLIGRNVTVGLENGGFFEAERIFSDYGIKTLPLKYDKDGATIDSLKTLDPDILFMMPSLLPKISPTTLSKRRNSIRKWVEEKENRLIIEDDYNGELRYTARSVPAFQQRCPQKTVYIGSFSKLLLPSVRIAYMVLPDFLISRFREFSHCYNQTCGKIEQLALEKYISSGSLEKHLKKLRRLYYNKSQILIRELEDNLRVFKAARLYESSLTVELETTLDMGSCQICQAALEYGINLLEAKQKGCVRLCFAGIAEEEIAGAVKYLDTVFGKIK